MTQNCHKMGFLLKRCRDAYVPTILASFAMLWCGQTAETMAAGEREWIITLEEPTGIYRRDEEVVTAKLSFQSGEAWKEKLAVLRPDGSQSASQIEVTKSWPDGSIQTADLLFPASIIPGERPEYRLITAKEKASQAPYGSPVIARAIGRGRFEIANSRFGIIVNLGLENTEPAIVGAFNKSAGESRMLNVVDTTPDAKVSPEFGKNGAGLGTFLGKSQRRGMFDQVRILESGPLRARVQLSGARLGDQVETWEFVWHAGSPVVAWKSTVHAAGGGVPYGFFFNSISASPYLPFDRWADGSEGRFPDGPETDNPPDREIGGKDWADLPGGHIVYYRREENYGAIGIYELDKRLEWKGVGKAAFYAAAMLQTDKPAIQIALAFPTWMKTESVLEARKEYRRFMQPILSVVKPGSGSVAATLKPRIEEAAVAKPVAELKRAMSGSIPELSLNGPWKLQWAEKSEGEKQGFHRAEFADGDWRSVQVPGSVHTQILQSPQYYARSAEWISEKEWWYRREFRVPLEMRGRRLKLRFDATDYYADIWLNGWLIGRHEGYVDPHQYDITAMADTEKENHLAVRVWTPVSYYWRHRPYTVKGSYGAVDQKPDNITAEGITRPVRLIAGGPVSVRDFAVDTRLNEDGSADVVVDLELEAEARARQAEVTLRLIPRTFESATGLELKSSFPRISPDGLYRMTLHIKDPKLWWTWDHGKPDLYTLDVAVESGGRLSDRRSCAVGIREIEHADWKFYLNGKRLFVRGTNYYYNLFLSEVKRADYERDLALIRAMNVNMIRLHCHFTNPEFYDLADELGILIWQDYLEAWYPEDRVFSLKAAALYDPHIRYVRNHPCVAIWATSDEESLENYRDLTKHLEPRLYQLDPQRRPVVRSTGRYGDEHVYHGWYGGSIWQYTSMTERFVSELGATALPNYDSLIKFLPDAWPIEQHEEEWIFYKLQIAEAMRAWGKPGNMTLQEYIPQTQDYVARLFQLALERMRRLKYKPAGGILHFHAVDIWPSVTMAALDFYRQPTKAYHTVTRAFQMVLPSFAYDRGIWKSGEEVKAELWLINDHWFPLPGLKVSWRLVNEKGDLVQDGGPGESIELAPDSAVQHKSVAFRAGPPGNYALWARIVDSSGKQIADNNYEFRVQ